LASVTEVVEGPQRASAASEPQVSARGYSPTRPAESQRERRYDPIVDPERARELLAQERRRIEAALGQLGPDDVGELADQDEPADRGSELYADELDEGIGGDLREKLAAVERAEARLEQGTYGLSIESGEPIADERLEVFPTAERTVEEQERYDGRRGE
jgi:DnaK suppressor protein